MNANVKNKKDEWFRVISRLSRRSVGAKGDVSRAIIPGLAILIFAVVPLGFAESFPNRPTPAELEKIVVLGTQCARGVNERCWATQYQTNPVTYRVAPFTNNARWYLDKNLMGAMASKIRSLVPWYANTNTIYSGTTNISMLTVTGVWAQLEIGDHTTQFTATPAIGTNVATYGDSPWRIYKTDLEERYKVLNALKIPAWYVSQPQYISASWVSWGRALSTYDPIWNYGYLKQWYEFPATTIGLDHWDEMTATGSVVYAAESISLDSENEALAVGQPPSQFSAGRIYSYTPAQRIWRVNLETHKSFYTIGPFSKYAPHSVIVWATATNISFFGSDFDTFGGNGAIGTMGVSVKIIDVTNSYNVYESSKIIGNNDQPIWCNNPYPLFWGGYSLGHTHTSSNWWWQSSYALVITNFNYCTNKY